MKNSQNENISVWLALFLLLIVTLISYGCTGSKNGFTEDEGSQESDNMLELDFSIELQIRQDYLEQFVIGNNPEMNVNDVIILKNYGIYNNLVIITTNFDSYDAAVVRYMEVDGVQFNFYGWEIITWRNGRFYNLEEASAQGYLTQDNLKQIKKDFEETDFNTK